jgi:hypothetical protein
MMEYFGQLMGLHVREDAILFDEFGVLAPEGTVGGHMTAVFACDGDGSSQFIGLHQSIDVKLVIAIV